MKQSPFDYTGLGIAARMAQADLRDASAALHSQDEPLGRWIQVVKSALLACSTVCELELTVRRLYCEHPDLSDLFQTVRDELTVARYLRNIFVGHVNRDLVAKAVEWRPEMRVVALDDGPQAAALLSLFLLETAINTYVAPDGSHRLFSSETDLVYPPDMERFRRFLEKVVRGSLASLDRLLDIVGSEVPQWSSRDEMFEQYTAAGRTDFIFLRRRR